MVAVGGIAPRLSGGKETGRGVNGSSSSVYAFTDASPDAASSYAKPSSLSLL